jgi:hypothetical protein
MFDNSSNNNSGSSNLNLEAIKIIPPPYEITNRTALLRIFYSNIPLNNDEKNHGYPTSITANTITSNNNNNNNSSKKDTLNFDINNPPIPVRVLKWVDFSNKYGMAYILTNGLIGVVFNDQSKMVSQNNHKKRGKEKEKEKKKDKEKNDNDDDVNNNNNINDSNNNGTNNPEDDGLFQYTEKESKKMSESSYSSSSFWKFTSHPFTTVHSFNNYPISLTKKVALFRVCYTETTRILLLLNFFFFFCF